MVWDKVLDIGHRRACITFSWVFRVGFRIQDDILYIKTLSTHQSITVSTNTPTTIPRATVSP